MKKIFIFLIILLLIPLLSFSLLFGYKTFFSISHRQECLGCGGSAPTRDMFDNINDPVALVTNSIIIAQGDSEDFVVGFKNIGTTDGDFSYKVIFDSGPSKLKSVDWMPSGGDLGSLKIDDNIIYVLTLDVPDDAVLGVYKFKIELTCSADGCGTGKRFPFIISVTV